MRAQSTPWMRLALTARFINAPSILLSHCASRHSRPSSQCWHWVRGADTVAPIFQVKTAAWGRFTPDHLTGQWQRQSQRPTSSSVSSPDNTPSFFLMNKIKEYTGWNVLSINYSPCMEGGGSGWKHLVTHRHPGVFTKAVAPWAPTFTEVSWREPREKRQSTQGWRAGRRQWNAK